MPTLELKPIGVIHSPWTDTACMPIQPAGAAGVTGRVEVFDDYIDGLADLDGFSHVYLLYHFHRSAPFRLRVVPFMDTQPRGLFATRAPNRPNPIGLSIVRLDSIEHNILHVRGVDILDGTPLLDIKPYVAAFDHQTAVRSGWVDDVDTGVTDFTSDDRFRY